MDVLKQGDCVITAIQSLTERWLTDEQLYMRADQLNSKFTYTNGGDVTATHRFLERVASQPQTEVGEWLSKRDFHWEKMTPHQIKKALKKEDRQIMLADEKEEHAMHLYTAGNFNWFSDRFNFNYQLESGRKYRVIVFTEKQ